MVMVTAQLAVLAMGTIVVQHFVQKTTILQNVLVVIVSLATHIVNWLVKMKGGFLLVKVENIE